MWAWLDTSLEPIKHTRWGRTNPTKGINRRRHEASSMWENNLD